MIKPAEQPKSHLKHCPKCDKSVRIEIEPHKTYALAIAKCRKCARSYGVAVQEGLKDLETFKRRAEKKWNRG